MTVVIDIVILAFIGYLLMNFGYVLLCLTLKYRIVSGFLILLIVLVTYAMGWWRWLPHLPLSR
jgi:hypothetical protein